MSKLKNKTLIIVLSLFLIMITIAAFFFIQSRAETRPQVQDLIVPTPTSKVTTKPNQNAQEVKSPELLPAPSSPEAKVPEADPVQAALIESKLEMSPEAKPEQKAKSVETNKQVEQAPIPYINSGNLARYSSLQAELEELKLQVQIKEQRDKLNASSASVVPTITLPPIDFPPDFSPSPEPVKTTKTKLLAISSFDNETIAKVQTNSGTVTLKKGDKFENSTVKNISEAGLELSNGKKMRFE